MIAQSYMRRCLLLGLSITACSAPVRQQTAPANLPDTTVAARVVQLAPSSILLDSARVDVSGDQIPETIRLYVRAERGADGKVLWEDGHSWYLIVQQGDQTYPLLDGFIPWGLVHFRVIDTVDEGGRSIVVERESSTGGIRIDEWRFDAARRVYLRRNGIIVSGRTTAVSKRLP